MLCPAAIVWIRLQSQSLGIPKQFVRVSVVRTTLSIEKGAISAASDFKVCLGAVFIDFILWLLVYLPILTKFTYPCQMWNLPANVYKPLFKWRIINEKILTGRLGLLRKQRAHWKSLCKSLVAVHIAAKHRSHCCLQISRGLGVETDSISIVSLLLNTRPRSPTEYGAVHQPDPNRYCRTS